MRGLLLGFLSLLFVASSAAADRAVQVEFLLAGLTDNNGDPLNGGKVYSYESGTTTPQALYTTQDQTTAATNPLILDSNGRARVFAEGSYKLVIKDASDNTLYTWDNLQYVYPATSSIYAGTSTGSSNTYALTPSPAVTAYTDGLQITFIANHASSAAATLNVSGLGAKDFLKADGSTDLTTGDIESGMLVNALYVAGSDHFRLVNQSGVVPISGGGTGAATAAGARSNLDVQQLDTELTGLAGVTSAADKVPYFTGSGTAAVATLTSFLRTVLDDTDAATARGTLGLGTISTQAANSVTISGGAITGITDLAVADGGTGASTATDARTNLSAAKSGSNSDITALTGVTSSTWTGTWTGSGTITDISPTYLDHTYQRLGAFVIFQLSVSLTCNGAGQIIYVTLPASASSYDSLTGFPCHAEENGVAKSCAWRTDGTKIVIYQHEGGNWSCTAGTIRLHIDGKWRV